MSINILVLLANQVEEIELITPVDIWRRAGYSVTIASIDSNLSVIGQQRIVISADTTLDTVDDSQFDYLFIAGGSSELSFKEAPQAMEMIKKFIDHQKTIIAICGAPLLLIPWLKHKNATCYPSLKDALPHWVDQDIVIDLPFITSQGVGTSHLLAFYIVEMISGKVVAEELKKDTLFK